MSFNHKSLEILCEYTLGMNHIIMSTYKSKPVPTSRADQAFKVVFLLQFAYSIN